ncbi:MAG: tetraacyldisaccharide 4'-kinase [Gemmatimonadota bacterium]
MRGVRDSGLSAAERHVRTAWRRRPGAVLRALGAAYGLGAGLRNLLYDAGTLRAVRAPVRVMSVGGLTVGGSGKTPIAAHIARWLEAAGHRPAIVTRGYADELELHRILAPGSLVLGHPDRIRAIGAAAVRGATVAVLDDGFQHRSVFRELDLLLVDADALCRTNRRLLPAGPFRDPFARVADATIIVVTRRSSSGPYARRLAAGLRRRTGGRAVARCALQPAELRPANRAAVRSDLVPSTAVAGVMKPGLFFRSVQVRWPEVNRFFTFRDHHGPDDARLASIVQSAGEAGLLGTLKDVVRCLPRVGERVPVWYVEDRVLWEAGEEEVRRSVLEAAGR